MYLQCQGGKESNFFIVVPGKRFNFGKIYDDKRVRKLTSLIVIFYVYIYISNSLGKAGDFVI